MGGIHLYFLWQWYAGCGRETARVAPILIGTVPLRKVLFWHIGTVPASVSQKRF